MRRAAKIDANHGEIVHALVKAGCAILSLAAVGRGCPDILCSRSGGMYLLEVKDGSKPPSARQLTPEQRRFHALWQARIHVVTSPLQALEAVGLRNT